MKKNEIKKKKNEFVYIFNLSNCTLNLWTNKQSFNNIHSKNNRFKKRDLSLLKMFFFKLLAGFSQDDKNIQFVFCPLLFSTSIPLRACCHKYFCVANYLSMNWQFNNDFIYEIFLSIWRNFIYQLPFEHSLATEKGWEPLLYINNIQQFIFKSLYLGLSGFPNITNSIFPSIENR